jgi:plastocyanin
MKQGFESLPVLGIVLFIFVTTFPPIEVTIETNLVAHMAQHVVIAIAGVLIGYPLYRAGKLSRIKGVKTGIMGLIAIAALLVFWHLPNSWDAAVLNPLVHIVEHFCFLGIGFAIGALLPMLPDNFKILTLLLAISAHMFYGFALFLINTSVYPLYPVNQQSTLGVFMFAPAPIYFIGFLYITLTRQSRRFEAHLHDNAPRRSNGLYYNSISKFVIPLLSLAMIISLGGYLAVTVAAISSSPQTSNIPVIYIDETPFTWQYSPQNITVVMGINNTIEWISHSLSYDTVTSTDLNFSHAFSPGDSFSYTFSSAGVFHYYCIYHPWMHGTVVVLPAQ